MCEPDRPVILLDRQILHKIVDNLSAEKVIALGCFLKEMQALQELQSAAETSLKEAK